MIDKSKIKFIAVSVLVVLVILIVVIRLNVNGKNRIVGTWEYEYDGQISSDQIVTFNKNGSFYDPEGFMVNETSGKWEIISEGKLHLDWGHNDEILDYEFQGGKLIIDGEIFKKK